MITGAPKGWTPLDPAQLAEFDLTVDEAADAYEMGWPETGLSHERKAERMMNEVLKGRVSPAEVKAAAQQFREDPPTSTEGWSPTA